MTCYQKNFTPYQREAVAKLKAILGKTPFSFEKAASNHLQVKIEGIPRVFYTGSTPSDHRSLNNFLGDVKAEIKRMNTQEHTPSAPPKSQQKAQAKTQAFDFVKRQTQQQQKRLKQSLRQIRKQEYKMLTALQDKSDQLLACDILAKHIDHFRHQQSAVELELSIHKYKGDLFITPGLIRSAKQELMDFLDQHLDTRAEYRERLKKRHQQRRLTQNQALPLAVCDIQDSDDTNDPKSDRINMVAPNTTGFSDVPNGTECSLENNLEMHINTLQVEVDTCTDNLPQLMSTEKHQRLASLKKLSKQQIQQLMIECQATLEQKHLEDISFLLKEMHCRGIEWHELEAAAAH